MFAIDYTLLLFILLLGLFIRFLAVRSNYIRYYDNALNICLSIFSGKMFKLVFNENRFIVNLFQTINDGWYHKNVVHANVVYHVALWPFLRINKKIAARMLHGVNIIPVFALLFFIAVSVTGRASAPQLLYIYSIMGSSIMFAQEAFQISFAALPFYAFFCLVLVQANGFVAAPVNPYSGIVAIVGIFFTMWLTQKILEHILFMRKKIGLFFVLVFVLAIAIFLIKDIAQIKIAELFMGILCSLTFFSYTGLLYSLLGLIIFFAAGILYVNGIVAGLQLLIPTGIWFVVGAILPILLIELYFRLLKWKGYPYKTFLQFFLHTNQTINQDVGIKEVYTATINHRVKSWQFINLFVSLEGFIFTGLLVLGVLYSLFNMKFFDVFILFQFFYGLYTWFVFPSGKSARYFYNNFFLTLPFLIWNGLQFFPYAIQWLILGAAFFELFINRRWLFAETGFTKSIKWLEQQGAKRVFGANFYPLNLVFGRANVKYAPSSEEELATLVQEGFHYWVVGWETDFPLTPEQEAMLLTVEAKLSPVYEVHDDFFDHIPLFWQYANEAAMTAQWDKGTRALNERKRENIKIYDLRQYAG